MDISSCAFCITSLYIMGVIISKCSNVTAIHSRPRWEMPCGIEVMPPSNPNFPPPPTEAPSDPADIITGILVQVSEGQKFSEILKQNMTRQRIQSSTRQSELDRFNWGGFPHVTPSTEAELDESVKNITKTKLISYKDLSTIAVFFEQMKLDEQIYEDGFLLDKMGRVESKVYDILCHLYTSLRNMDAEISHVTRESMEMHVSTISDDVTRHDRDYVITKDTKKYLDKMLTDYEYIMNDLVNES